MDREGSVVIGVVFFLIGLGVAIALYLTTKNEDIKVASIALFGVVFFAGIIGLILHFTSSSTKIRKLLKDVEERLLTATIDELKEIYLKIYNLYMKLHPRHKQNFYGRVTKVRGHIEESLKTSKKIEELLGQTGKVNKDKRKKIYSQITKLMEKLPAKEKEKFQTQVGHLKDELEK